MKKKKSKDKKLKIKYVYKPSPDAEERISRAFNILFQAVIENKK